MLINNKLLKLILSGFYAQALFYKLKDNVLFTQQKYKFRQFSLLISTLCYFVSVNQLYKKYQVKNKNLQLRKLMEFVFKLGLNPQTLHDLHPLILFLFFEAPYRFHFYNSFPPFSPITSKIE